MIDHKILIAALPLALFAFSQLDVPAFGGDPCYWKEPKPPLVRNASHYHKWRQPASPPFKDWCYHKCKWKDKYCCNGGGYYGSGYGGRLDYAPFQYDPLQATIPTQYYEHAPPKPPPYGVFPSHHHYYMGSPYIGSP